MGEGALRLGRLLEREGDRAGVPVALAAAAADVGLLARSLPIPILAQHADPREPGAQTGWIVPESLRAAGARGSLVGHSEHPLSDPLVPAVVDRLRAAGLSAVVCAREDRQARRRALSSRPDYLAVEPPALIGGDVSVSSAEPELIARSVRLVRAASARTRVLCGAGIHDAADVRQALELGTEGVLLASAVTKAPRPAEVLRELLRGFPRH